MNTEIAMIISGLLFWLIIITNVSSERFGYKTLNDLEPKAKLETIGKKPKAFKISVVLILIEHMSIIALAVMLFVVFGSYSLLLGIIWLLSRTLEGLIQIYYKKIYWKLLDLAKHYQTATETEKNTLVGSARALLKTKTTTFTFAQILFSIGTLAYSILFVAYDLLPAIIGWFGIVAAVLYGLGNWLTPIQPKFKYALFPGALLILIYEIVLGGWLIFVHTIP